jgi:predicted enzyme related to lactoylglutathione lyase
MSDDIPSRAGGLSAEATGHIHHVGIIVRPENVEKYVSFLSRVLGVTFDDPIVNDKGGLIAVVSWESGLEVMAPLRQEGGYWERIARFGEGTCVIVFGATDIDIAIARARENGVELGWEVRLEGDDPILGRFRTFREARLLAFPEEFAASLALCQIEPV